MRPTTALLLGFCLAVPAFAEAPPAPPKATGELTAGEQLFQGEWHLVNYHNGEKLGPMTIDGRDFEAEWQGWYAGYLSIRTDSDPPQIDFTITDCKGCGRQGKTSRGIYRVEDDVTILISGPEVDAPRRTDFSKDLWRLRRVTD